MKFNTKFLLVTYPEFVRMILGLCIKLKAEIKKGNIDYIVSVQRGGAVMSKIVSDVLDIPIRSLTVKTAYKGMVRDKSSFLSEPLREDIKGKKIVVLDEISETGKTLIFVKKYLNKMNPTQAIFATIFIKPKTRFIPDLYLQKTSKWIIFPYELKEMYDLMNNGNFSKTTKLGYVRYLKINGVKKSDLDVLFGKIS